MNWMAARIAGAAGVSLLVVASCASQALGDGYAVGANFRASRLSESGFIPPDTMGAVGPNHVAVMINGRYESYTKDPGVSINGDGYPLAAYSLTGFWQFETGIFPPDYAFDPRITYDPFAQRWYAAAADTKESSSSGLLFAVSKTADPTQGWDGFRMPSDPVGQRWCDYPMLGFDGDYVYISYDNIGLNGTPDQYPLIAFPKADLLGPSPSISNRQTLFLDPDFNQTVQALDNLGPSVQPYHLWEEGFASMPYNRITESGGVLTNVMGSANLGTFVGGAPHTPRQPDGSTSLDIDSERISTQLVRIDGSYWCVLPRLGGADNVLRWIQIDATSLTLQQTGTVGVAGLDMYYPSIAVNSEGDVVIGFTGSGPSAGQYPSAYAVVGTTTGGVTSFGTPVLLQAGVDSYYVNYGRGNRWGDYSSTVLDPADPNIFWTFQEWASARTDWSVQVSEIVTYGEGEVYWAENASGDYATGANWLTGSAPTSGEHAIFSRAAGSYTVNFAGSQTNDRASVRQGTLTWDLGGNTYALNNASASTPSLSLAEFQGAAALTVTGGTLETAHTHIGSGLGADASLSVTNATWNNSGDVHLAGTPSGAAGAQASLIIGSGALVNVAGTVKVHGGGNTQLNNGRLIAATIDAAAADFDWTGGVLSAGHVTFDLVQNGGTLAPGASLGTTTVDGAYTLNSGSVELEFDWDGTGSPVAGTHFDHIAAGAVSLDPASTLDLVTLNATAANLEIGDEFQVLTATSLSGMFAEVSGVVLDTMRGMAVLYDSTDITVRTSLRGDTDLDDDVDTADLTLMFQNFNGSEGSGLTWIDGDNDGDGDVDTADITIGFQNFTGALASLSSLAESEAWLSLAESGELPDPVNLPEPASLVLLAVGLAMTGLYARRRPACHERTEPRM